MVDKFIGQCFYVSLAESGAGLLGFSGQLLSIDGDFWTFQTFNDTILVVNSAWIKSLRPVEKEK
jgi:hypothetical protein